jgi:hypothetical protein
MPYRRAVDEIARGVCTLSRMILSFSSSAERRRRLVSTTPGRSTCVPYLIAVHKDCYTAKIRRVRYSVDARKRERWGKRCASTSPPGRAGSELSDILFTHPRKKSALQQSSISKPAASLFDTLKSGLAP